MYESDYICPSRLRDVREDLTFKVTKTPKEAIVVRYYHECVGHETAS